MFPNHGAFRIPVTNIHVTVFGDHYIRVVLLKTLPSMSIKPIVLAIIERGA